MAYNFVKMVGESPLANGTVFIFDDAGTPLTVKVSREVEGVELKILYSPEDNYQSEVYNSDWQAAEGLSSFDDASEDLEKILSPYFKD